jgi:hypothetical protein
MSQKKKGILSRILTFVLNTGADPRDSDYVRLIKRIWYSATAISLPTSF